MDGGNIRMNQEIKKQEAIKRMKSLNIIDDCIKAFETNNEVWMSENNGILFELNDNPKIQSAITKLEQEYNILVYHCIKTCTEFGVLITMFYVSDQQEEWLLDWEDMEYNYACCYVLNMDDDTCSEFGTIEYEKINGGLKRLA